MESSVKERLGFFETPEDLVLSLLCTFGDWYNSSGQAERLERQVGAANFTRTAVELFVQEWRVFLPPRHTRALQICPILGFVAVFVTTPTILAHILSRVRLRQQTRYLLLANVLLSDLLFVALYMLSTCLNTAAVLMSAWTCAAVLFLMGALYCTGLFSATAIVLDTSLAVLAPLRYATLWPLATTYRVISAIWAVSVSVPAASVSVFLWYHVSGPCRRHICSLPVVLVLTVSHSRPLQVCMLLTVTTMLLSLLLVLSGYVALCCQTRRAGVWRRGQSSRARGTFLIHYLYLFLSMCPMMLLAIELLTYCYSKGVNPRTSLWVSLVLCNVLLVLPKSLAPYLYGLRYRDLRGALRDCFGLRRTRAVTPVT
ncbi:probable G-protein coupled receptor 148 [Electrophorus electricus]|uniref:probable G-protein coupled receptor 148 n=1 Tax=Electrophorus electricus TaxID=8005 RepID=UPI000F0A571E|nr:probable G-protein coupled receptor 148 [Electrophorus electricus]